MIECKFTPEATKPHYEAEKLRSSHLYQIHAYLSNLPAGELNDSCEVILLYPTVDMPMNASYVYEGHKISIRTVDLNQPWRGIHQDLVAMVA
jgi:5-methylcytosine-specific restriction enzyme subunit McrC